jgi:transglutaminase-like putative cysteine protease
MQRARGVMFGGWESKAAYLDGAAWDDARAPVVRDIARRVAKSIDPNRQDLIAHAVFDFVKRAIRYVKDPASEEFSDAEEILRAGFGDCDDKVRLFVALCRSLGLEARVRPVLQPAQDGGRPDFTHVQAEVRWPGSYLHARARAAGWITAELILAACELGDEPQDVASRALV